jgi:FMN phosphatase YigB (HAD superfamily)
MHYINLKSYLKQRGVDKLNTILFDLDGTLLSMDMILFEKIYFQELAKDFADIMSPKELAQNIWSSTKAMVQNIEYKTNEEVFMADFTTRMNMKLPILQKRFETFYDTSFLKIKDLVLDVKCIKESVNILKSKGYTVALATNPLFPENAIHHRIRWAGFEPEEFSYISTFEKNHYCKPQLKYYEEILMDIKKNPSECLMVGNDVQEDLIAKKLGMKTYLITNNLLHRTDEEIVTDYTGEYEDFYKYVQELPSLK